MTSNGMPEQMQIKPVKIIYRVNIFEKMLNNNF